MGSALTLSTGVITVSEGVTTSSSSMKDSTVPSLTIASTSFSTSLITGTVV